MQKLRGGDYQQVTRERKPNEAWIRTEPLKVKWNREYTKAIVCAYCGYTNKIVHDRRKYLPLSMVFDRHAQKLMFTVKNSTNRTLQLSKICRWKTAILRKIRGLNITCAHWPLSLERKCLWLDSTISSRETIREFQTRSSVTWSNDTREKIFIKLTRTSTCTTTENWRHVTWWKTEEWKPGNVLKRKQKHSISQN